MGGAWGEAVTKKVARITTRANRRCVTTLAKEAKSESKQQEARDLRLALRNQVKLVSDLRFRVVMICQKMTI